jgi:serine/threonine protein kinase
LFKFRSKKFHNFVESCLIKDYLIRSNCEQLLKHSFIRDCQEKQIKLQIKEYLDKTRKFRRSSNNSHQQINQDIQKQSQQKSDDEDEDDDDDDDDDNDDHLNRNIHSVNNNIQEEHFTQRENNLNTLRQNFKCVQHTSTSRTIIIIKIDRTNTKR